MERDLTERFPKNKIGIWPQACTGVSQFVKPFKGSSSPMGSKKDAEMRMENDHE